MNHRPDNERLLADVLGAEADPGFSAGVLAETLRGVRRRRRGRQLRRYGAGLVALLVVALVSSHFLPRGRKPELARLPQPPSYQLIASQPLTSGQIIDTQSLAPDQQVVSSASVGLIRTTTGGFGEIGDEELISLAAPRVVALVRRGPHEAELVFVSSPSDNSDSSQN